MTLLLPFIIPAIYGYSAYRAANFELTSKASLQQENVPIVEKLNLRFCASKGTSFFENAVIFLAPGFSEVDKEACQFVLKHELCHIRNDDLFTIPLVACISSFAAAIFGTLTLPLIPTTLLTCVIGMAALILFTRWREEEADNGAIEGSSREELLGGRRFFLALQRLTLEQFGTGGDHQLDLFHPSLTSRIQKIELSLKPFQFQKHREEEFIEKLKKFMILNKNELEQKNC